MNTDNVELHNTNGKKLSFKDWIPVLVVLATVIPSAIGWYLNEDSKRSGEDFRRKEERYSALLDSLPAFMSGQEDIKQQDEFMRQLRLCWLYCPDEVIKQGQDFLITLLPEHKDKFSADDRTQAIRCLVLAIRKDLISREKVKKTNLRPEDYVIFSRKGKPNKASEAIGVQEPPQPQR